MIQRYKEPVFADDLIIDDSAIADIQAAIQAAWRADPAYAVQLAQRYGLYDKICLRCVERGLTALEPSSIVKSALGALAYQLCINCVALEARERRRPGKPVNFGVPCVQCAQPATQRVGAFGDHFHFCDPCFDRKVRGG